MMRLSVLIAFIMSWAVQAHSGESADLVRRVVVFPMSVEKAYAAQADSVWWDLRERLSESKRFLIASKNFMQSKDVFQPRSELEPADAIILGRLLEADTLITSYLKNRTLYMQAYEGRRGQLLWKQYIELHPSLPISKQLQENSRKLILDFIASIPYQGFIVVDAILGRPIAKDGETYVAYADIGQVTGLQNGDAVQIILMESKSLEPLFQGGGSIEVLAEGVVTRVNKGVATLNLMRVKNPELIKEKSFVRLPTEFKRLRDSYTLKELNRIDAELRYIDMGNQISDKQKEKKPLATAISFFANIAIFLALAF